ncbi:hypothetical protein [Streptomyces lydicamycinicus]|uniref:hypothetical protein n=1 Tax=Streptomyces lydicamycinicus TaxID=1546107 RepID=UPI003C307A12
MAIPPAAAAVIRAALDDYRLTVPPGRTTAAGQVHRIAEYLAASGFTICETGTCPTGRPGDIEPAALAALRMALQIYAVLTPPELATPHDQTEYAAREMTAAGWHVIPDTRTRSAAA